MNIPKFIEALGTAFKEGIFAFTNNMGAMLSQLGPILKDFVINVMDGLTELLNDLPGIAYKFVEALIPAFKELVNRLPDLIEKFFEAIPALIDAFISFIPDIAVALLDKMPEIVASFIKGFIESQGKIVTSLIDTFITKGGAVRIAVAFIESMIMMIPAVTDAFATGIKNALIGVFKGFSYPLPDITELQNKVDELFNKIQRNAAKVADQVFSVIDIPEGGGSAKSAAKELEKVIKIAIEGGVKQVDGLWEALKALWDLGYLLFVYPLEVIWKWAYEYVILPLVETASVILGGILTALRLGVETLLSGLWKWLLQTPEVLQGALAVVTELVTVFLPEALQATLDMGILVLELTFKLLGTVVEGLFGFLQRLPDIVKSAFSIVYDIFLGVNNAFLIPFTEGIMRAFQWVNTHILHPTKVDRRAIFDPFAATLNSIREPFNTLADALRNFNPAGILEGITGGGGGGAVGQVVDFVSSGGGLFANGGLVKNPGFVETPGEFVLKKSAVDSLGADTLDFMNRTGQMPSASGGKVLNIQSGAIQITQLPGENSQDLAERVLDEIKRRSVNGETVIFASGIRDR
jgi:hypothetical protein